MNSIISDPAQIRRDSVRYGYDSLNWSFTPLAGKRPTLDAWQSRPRETLADALAWADAGNVGIRTGSASGGLVVIDVDPGGEVESLDLPATVAAKSGGGARHFYFRSGRTLKNTIQKLGAHIDSRGEAGQVVFPGSIHPETGAMYEWIPGRDPWSIELAELPERICDQLEAPKPAKPAPPTSTVSRPERRSDATEDRYVARAIKFEVQAVRDAVEGTRNASLNNAALSLGKLVGGGYVARADIERELMEAAQLAGLPEFEAAATIKSGIDAGILQPRDVQAELAKRRPVGRPRKESDTPRRDTEPNAEKPASDSRPEIMLGTDEFRVVAETIVAMAADPGIFQRGNILVRSVRDQQPTDGILRVDGSATISSIPLANLRERLTQYAAFIRKDDAGEDVPCHPAAWLINAIHARGEWPGIRPLLGVSDAPILRPDGSVWQTPGYDDRTGVVFEPAKSATFPEISSDVTLDDADAAKDRLLDVVCDFRFESPEHRSAWLAGLLTPLARFAYSGASPLFLVDANVRAAGKGLLTQTIGEIVLGRGMPVSSYAHDPVEMRKRITACAIAGDRTILLDNLEGVFGNEAIDRALTTSTWKDRILGKSEEVELPLIATWYATGNNVQVAADTTRRLLHIRLDVLEERPENRSDFRHVDLRSWIRTNRPALLADALTILSAYIRAGAPKHSLTPFGSFEGWSGLVREAVVWSGMPDPCLTRAKLAESSDTTADALSQLIDAWESNTLLRNGITLSDLLGHLYPSDRIYTPNDEDSVAMRAAIEGIVGCPPGRVPTTRQVGNRMKQFRRRVVRDRFLDVDTSANDKHGSRWKLFSTQYRETQATLETL